jgi:hypothetical protein
MATCNASKLGTRKHGMMIHGNLVMIELPGASVNRRMGPGVEVAPNPTAAIRSMKPIRFQIAIHAMTDGQRTARCHAALPRSACSISC